jgi:pimeloyl-ACP methyl ester carboxylesterase
LAVHGITANAWHFDPLAHRLAGGAELIAVDLRGRGRSVAAPGEFGIRRHAADIARIAQDLGRPVTLLGHSMGAYVALMAVAQDPDLFDGILLVDGGAPLPAVESDAVEQTLDTTLGPAIARLRTVWPDRVSYQTMWAQHPAFDEGLTIDLERNLLADLVETDGGFRTAVNEAAVLVDGRDLLVDEAVRSLLASRSPTTTIVRAPNGLTGAPPPLIPDDVVESLSQHVWINVPNTNHYTVLLGPTGANAVADALRTEIQRH